MSVKNDNLPPWIKINAWREIFDRIFAGLEAKLNVSPGWLVNPATKRHLKLDIFYPAIGLAIRFEGLQGKQRRQRLSLEEEAQQRNRDDARVVLCRAHDVDLVLVDLVEATPKSIFQEVDMMLSRAKQRLKAADLVQKINQARVTASALSRQIESQGNFKLYADLWQDRQYRVLEAAPSPPTPSPAVTFTAGMAVEHTVFGPGVILAITPNDGDTLLTVDFINAGQKTLAASLVKDKLHPR